jgi:hypothetical protein
VFFDLVAGGPAADFGPPGFDAEAAFLFTDSGDYAYYDRGDGGSFDLVLLDGDSDGAAERMWTATTEGWRERSGVHVPLLSQSYLDFVRSRELSVAVTQAFGNLIAAER